MAHTFSLQNTFGAGQRLKSDLASAEQSREFNSLRLTGERQRQDIQQRTFDADQQRTNTEKLLNGIRIAKTNPSLLPQVGQELVASGILNEAELPAMLERAQSNPQEFQRGLADFEAQLMFALGQAPAKPKFGAAQAATRDGENVLIQTSPSGVTQEVEGFGPPSGTAAAGAAERFFGSLTADLSAEQQADARLIQLGLQERAGTTSSRERIATDPELTEDVAESEATIAGRKKFAERTGASRAKLIDEGFASIQSLDKNILNIDKAISALQEGARTGPIVSRFFPSIRAASVKLDQIRNELGLDVVGGVTFGALSKGELDLALNVALPTNLPPDELAQWLQDKKTAQEKLRAYFASQIEFLDQPGNTIAKFLRQLERGGQQGGGSGSNVIRFDAQGNPIG